MMSEDDRLKQVDTFIEELKTSRTLDQLLQPDTELVQTALAYLKAGIEEMEGHRVVPKEWSEDLIDWQAASYALSLPAPANQYKFLIKAAPETKQEKILKDYIGGDDGTQKV